VVSFIRRYPSSVVCTRADDNTAIPPSHKHAILLTCPVGQEWQGTCHSCPDCATLTPSVKARVAQHATLAPSTGQVWHIGITMFIRHCCEVFDKLSRYHSHLF